MFDGNIYFLSALYHVRGGFSHLPSFVRPFAGELNQLPYERTPVLEKIQQLREEYAYKSETIGQEEALKLMIAEDLGAVEAILQNEFLISNIDKRRHFDAVLERCKDEAVHLLSKMGVHVNPPPIFIVDKLPYPYTNEKYSALTADEGDRERYGINPGLYFTRDDLRPFYSEFLLMHELIHTILGRKSPYLLARGLEEGLAELIGGMYLSSKVLGKELTTNLFIYNRLSYQHQQFWELYMDATRQATLLYHRFGLRGVLALINKNRAKLKEIEKYFLRMEFDKIDLPKGELDADLSDISDFLSMAFGRNLVVSPLAKYLCSYVRPDRTVAEIISEAGVNKAAGKRALKELKDRVRLISFSDGYDDYDDDTIVIQTDCDRLCGGSVIRYELPETTCK